MCLGVGMVWSVSLHAPPLPPHESTNVCETMAERENLPLIRARDNPTQRVTKLRLLFPPAKKKKKRLLQNSFKYKLDTWQLPSYCRILFK